MSKVKKIFSTALAITCLSGLTASPVSIAPAASPDTAPLIETVLVTPARTYKGHLMINHWTEKSTTAEDVNIYYTPPNNYRMEFLAPNGTVDRVVLSNTYNEQVFLMQNGQLVPMSAITYPASILNAQQEKVLLLQNYKASIQPAANLFGRATWLVELTPTVAGKPYHQIRIDRLTSVVLEEKQYLPQGSTGSLMRFTSFEPVATLPAALFLENLPLNKETLAPGSGTDQEMGTTIVKLNGGFSLQSIEHFELTGKEVKHVRYTDGMLPLSLFQTPVPVRIPNTQSSVRLSFSTAGSVYSWEKDKKYYTLIGDVQEDLLQTIAQTIGK